MSFLFKNKKINVKTNVTSRNFQSWRKFIPTVIYIYLERNFRFIWLCDEVAISSNYLWGEHFL